MNNIKIIIDNNILEIYKEYYLKKYPRRKKCPIEKPIPPSLNQWMVMKRFQMNHQKQIWKEFGEWLVDYNGLAGINIERCRIIIEYFFGDRRKRDLDNYSPKYLFDAFTSVGLLVDDDYTHIESLLIKAGVDKDNPRMQITISLLEGSD